MSYQPIWDGRSGYGGRKRRPLKRALLVLLGLCLVFYGAMEIFIALHDDTVLAGEPRTMVVFGCQVWPHGPSILLRDRLDTALDYLDDHPDMKVVVTGGKGDDEHISEAQCMYDYLTEHGVDGENIYMEDQSRNTWQNVNYTLELLESEVEAGRLAKPQGYVLVSSGFHLARIEMLWTRAGGQGENISTLAAPVSHRPSAVQMFFREPLALVKSFVFDR